MLNMLIRMIKTLREKMRKKLRKKLRPIRPGSNIAIYADRSLTICIDHGVVHIIKSDSTLEYRSQRAGAVKMTTRHHVRLRTGQLHCGTLTARGVI